MRVLRLALAGLLATAGVLIGTPASYAAGGGQLSAPDQVGPTTSFEVVFRYPRPSSACQGNGKRVVFSWDNQTLGSVGPLRLNQTTCQVKVKLSPPATDNGQGQHTLGAAAVATPGNPTDSQTVTIVGDQQGNPKQNTPTSHSTPTTVTDTPTQAAAGDAVSQQPTPSVSPIVAAAAGQTPTKSGGGAISWLLVFGGILVGGGALAFGMLIWRMRRPRLY
jgi:hypothetical protein